MPLIVSAHPNQTGQLIAELNRLGGCQFTYTSLAGGPLREALEVTDEVYAAWQASLGRHAAPADEPAAQPGAGAPQALTAGRNTVAEHTVRDHLTTQGMNTVGEHTVHDYAGFRTAGSTAPRTAHDQADPPVVTVGAPTGLTASIQADNGGKPVLVSWGDGTATEEHPGDNTAITHAYAQAGTYMVTVQDKADLNEPARVAVTVAAPPSGSAEGGAEGDPAGSADSGSQDPAGGGPSATTPTTPGGTGATEAEQTLAAQAAAAQAADPAPPDAGTDQSPAKASRTTRKK